MTAGSKLLVLNDANCQRTLVPTPGSLLYSDGVTVFYADGGAVAPLALPSLATYIQEEATTIPSILSKFAAGVIAAVTPAVATDGLVLTSLAGEWLLAPIPAQLCFSPDDVIVECCCPLSFAVWVEDDSDPDNIVLCLRQFNFCEDATNIESGSIMSCEPDTGCIRKLVGTSGDQVPAWDVGTETWIPTEISDLVPTPESVLDVAQFSWETSLAPGDIPGGDNFSGFYLGLETGWTINQSGSVATSAAIVVPSAHNTLRITNAGWHQINITVSGLLVVTDPADDPNAFIWYVELAPTPGVAGFSPNTKGVATALGTVNGLEVDGVMAFSISLSLAGNFAAAATISFRLTTIGVNGNTVGEINTGELAVEAQGTITRIT